MLRMPYTPHANTCLFLFVCAAVPACLHLPLSAIRISERGGIGLSPGSPGSSGLGEFVLINHQKSGKKPSVSAPAAPAPAASSTASAVRTASRASAYSATSLWKRWNGGRKWKYVGESRKIDDGVWRGGGRGGQCLAAALLCTTKSITPRLGWRKGEAGERG